MCGSNAAIYEDCEREDVWAEQSTFEAEASKQAGSLQVCCSGGGWRVLRSVEQCGGIMEH